MGRRHHEPRPLDPVEPPVWGDRPVLDAEALRAQFDRPDRVDYTVGVEEEVMVIDRDTAGLVEVGEARLATVTSDSRFAPELRRSQLEIVTPPCRTTSALGAYLARARLDLCDLLAPNAIAVAGTHPVDSDWGALAPGERYEAIATEYAWATANAIPCGLHVHVALNDPERAIVVHDALRSYLPELAALAANAPFLDGIDTGLASVRRTLNDEFGRTGIPPAFGSWLAFADYVAWGQRGGVFPDASHLWWDARLHPEHATLEVRVADAQTRVDDAVALTAVVQALVAWLDRRAAMDEPLAVHDSHRIAENARRAARYGVQGVMLDLESGKREPARERIGALLDAIEDDAGALDGDPGLLAARALLLDNGADRQRYVAAGDGVDAVAGWIAAESLASAHVTLGAAGGPGLRNDQHG